MAAAGQILEEGLAERIWLARHFRSSAPSGAMIGRSDPGLGPGAWEEAERLRPALAGISKVYSSPLRRAVESARLLAGMEPEAVDAFRELDLGAWEGLTGAEARDGWPEIYEARGLDFAGVPPPGGESLRDLAARVWPAWDRLAASPEREILVVAHQAVNRVILLRERGLPLAEARSVEQPYGALTAVSCGPRGGLARRGLA